MAEGEEIVWGSEKTGLPMIDKRTMVSKREEAWSKMGEVVKITTNPK